MSEALRSFEVEFVGARPLTINRLADLHRYAWAQHTRETRRVWWGLAREARLPQLQRAAITVVPLHVNNKSVQDPGACAPEAKAAIDGLVDAKVLPDDGPAHVVWIRFDGPLVCGVDGMRIHVQEVAS